MKLYRIGRGQHINDLSGTGASMYGGRWNSKGKFMLYTAGSSSLALLESVVHMTKTAAKDFYLLCLEIPEGKIEEYSIEQLPQNWQQYPPPDLLKKFGDNFLLQNQALVLKVPSVVMPIEFNYLINPNHQHFKNVHPVFIKPLPIDDRLLKK